MTVAAELEGARKVAKNVAKAIIGEDEFRGELRPSSRCLLRLFSGFGYAGACGLERGRRSCGFRIRDRSGGGGGSGGGAVTRPVAWAPALVASCWCCRCILHFFSFSLTSMFFYDFFFFFRPRVFKHLHIFFFSLAGKWGGKYVGSDTLESQMGWAETGFRILSVSAHHEWGRLSWANRLGLGLLVLFKSFDSFLLLFIYLIS